MRDILLPLTDAAVFAQFIIIAALTITAAVALRRNRELRSFTTGLGVFAMALRAVRALL